MNQRYPSLPQIRSKMNAAEEESQLSYREIGEAMGCKSATTRKTVQQLLTARSVNFNPRLETIIAFAKAVKKPIEYFF